MKDWQFNVLFFVAVGGAVFLLIAPEIGLEKASSPTSVTGVGAILTYVLTQKKQWTNKDEPPKELPPTEPSRVKDDKETKP